MQSAPLWQHVYCGAIGRRFLWPLISCKNGKKIGSIAGNMHLMHFSDDRFSGFNVRKYTENVYLFQIQGQPGMQTNPRTESQCDHIRYLIFEKR
jgi:hypothetical protein